MTYINIYDIYKLLVRCGGAIFSYHIKPGVKPASTCFKERLHQLPLGNVPSSLKKYPIEKWLLASFTI